MILRDSDKFDFAKATRLFPASGKMDVEFSCTPAQSKNGSLYVELTDARGTTAVRLIFDTDGVLRTKAGARFKNITAYEAGKEYHVRIQFQTDTRSYSVQVNGGEVKNYIFYSPVHALSGIVFRTGSPRDFPTPETPADQAYDLKDAGESEPLAEFFIRYLQVVSGEL